MNAQEAIIQLECEATNLQGMLQEGEHASFFAEKRIEALDMAIAALQKQVAKKVIVKPWSPAVCPTCGQRLKWEEADHD